MIYHISCHLVTTNGLMVWEMRNCFNTELRALTFLNHMSNAIPVEIKHFSGTLDVPESFTILQCFSEHCELQNALVH